jgi:hypothetical protein
MRKMDVSSAKKTVQSGGRTAGRSFIKAEKSVEPRTEPWGTPEHVKPDEE